MLPPSSAAVRRTLLGVCCAAALLTAAAPATAGDQQHATAWTHGLSFQGFTGLLNTPSAYVQQLGSLQGAYTNQVDSHWRKRPGLQENYLLSVGLFGFAEVGGRLTEVFRPRGVNDLSAQVKISTQPLTADMPWFPVLAAGMQDVGGGATNLQSRYLVLSSELWRLRLSAGYGHGPDRMKGGFGGVELIAHDWVRLLGEYDTRDTNLGVRLMAPPLPYLPISVVLTGKTAVSGSRSGTFDIAAGFSIPLDLREWNGKKQGQGSGVKVQEAQSVGEQGPGASGQGPEKQGQGHALSLSKWSEGKGQEAQGLDVTGPVVAAGVGVVPDAPMSEPLSDQLLQTLQQRLQEQGFIRVKTGRQGKHGLVVQYENVRFPYNELDALGLVIGTATEVAPAETGLLTVITVRKGIAMQAVQVPLYLAKNYFNATGEARAELSELREALVVRADTGLQDVAYLEPTGNKGILDYLPLTTVTLAPGLKTHVGTDVGVFDYLLSLRPEVVVNPWKGGLLNARWDLPVAWSKNYNTWEPFSFERHEPSMDRLQLTQAFKLLPTVILNSGGGMIERDWYGTLNELIWQPGDGRHRLKAMQAWATSKDSNKKDINLYLGAYRYNLPELDLSLEGTGGRFWNQDEGFLVELKRFFGDAAVSLYYKNVTIVEKQHIQSVGLQFSIPLTTRKNIKLGPITIGGTDEWRYNQETTLTTASRTGNYLVPYTMAAVPQNSVSLERSYMNRDRLHAAYINTHLSRLRDAWFKFGHGQN